MDERVKTRTERKLAQRPPNKWRNRYWYDKEFRHRDGRARPPGEYPGMYIWPSRDIAEQKAIEAMRKRRGAAGVVYLGAIEVDD